MLSSSCRRGVDLSRPNLGARRTKTGVWRATGAPDGLTFTELKTSCELTDGNLNRHLKALEEAKAVRIRKEFVANRPQTTVLLSKLGRTSFLQYLQALEAVLTDAARKLEAPASTAVPHLGFFRARLADA